MPCSRSNLFSRTWTFLPLENRFKLFDTVFRNAQTAIDDGSASPLRISGKWFNVTTTYDMLEITRAIILNTTSIKTNANSASRTDACFSQLQKRDLFRVRILKLLRFESSLFATPLHVTLIHLTLLLLTLFQERPASRRKTKEGKEFFPGSLERR